MGGLPNFRAGREKSQHKTMVNRATKNTRNIVNRVSANFFTNGYALAGKHFINICGRVNYSRRLSYSDKERNYRYRMVEPLQAKTVDCMREDSFNQRGFCPIGFRVGCRRIMRKIKSKQNIAVKNQKLRVTMT